MIKKIMEEYHKKNPLKPGMLKEELRARTAIEPRLFGNLINSLKEIVIDKELVRLASFKATLSQVDESVKASILGLLEKGGFQPPFREELSQTLQLDMKRLTDILNLLAKEGSLVRISDTMYIPSSVHQKMIGNLRNFFSKKPDMTVAEFRDILNTSRKYALPLLEYLDSHKITLRVGDIRKLLLK
jgi:selenocysteine-specific elongation factor